MADKTQQTKGVVVQRRKGFVMCGSRNNKIHNDPNMFARWITRKYGFFTQQRRKFPTLFFLYYLLPGMKSGFSQPQNRIYHYSRHFYRKFDLFFNENAVCPKSLHYLHLHHTNGEKKSVLSYRAFNRRNTEPNEVFTTGRDSGNYFHRFFGRTPGSPLHTSQDFRMLRRKKFSTSRPASGGPTEEERSAASILISHFDLRKISTPGWDYSTFSKKLDSEFPSLAGRRRHLPGKSKESLTEGVKALVLPGIRTREFTFSPGFSIIHGRGMRDFSRPGSVSLPSLSHFSPLKNPAFDREPLLTTTGDDFKKTAASKKLMEEIQSEDMSGTSGRPGNSRQQNVDLDRLTDQVSRLLERKIRIEKEMRGW